PSHCPVFSAARRPHRELPSFPTRRSSDLARRTTVGTSRARKVTEHRPGLIIGLFSWGRARRGSRDPQNAPSWKPYSATLLRFFPDRKSTRLNSSHVSISYAVFCLKQKSTQ